MLEQGPDMTTFPDSLRPPCVGRRNLYLAQDAYRPSPTSLNCVTEKDCRKCGHGWRILSEDTDTNHRNRYAHHVGGLIDSPATRHSFTQSTYNSSSHNSLPPGYQSAALLPLWPRILCFRLTSERAASSSNLIEKMLRRRWCVGLNGRNDWPRHSIERMNRQSVSQNTAECAWSL